MYKWILIIIFVGLIFFSVMFRYDIVFRNTSSEPTKAYLLDRWTGDVWFINGALKTKLTDIHKE